MKIYKILFFMFLFTGYARAHILHVPGEHGEISTAVGEASDGDTVLVAPGTYTQSDTLRIDKAITLASDFIFTRDEKDIDETIIDSAIDTFRQWVELSAVNSRVCGFTFMGTSDHTVNMTSFFSYLEYCKFLGGKDQLSISDGGGYVGHCYFENAGDDGIDCDNSLAWIIEHNTIVNAHDDGLEVRLHDKDGPLTTHICRWNRIVGSGQSGIQLIDYEGDSFREFYIHNNVLLNCEGSGVSCMYVEIDGTDEAYKGSLMLERAFVYNNTFDGCNYGLTLSPGLVVLNNIFTGMITRGIERGEYVNDDNDSSIVDYCLFYDNPEHFDADVQKGDHIFLDRDPLLTEEHDLSIGSPCIDAGVAQYEWNGDELIISAENYSGDGPDLGAKEFDWVAGVDFTPRDREKLSTAMQKNLSDNTQVTAYPNPFNSSTIVQYSTAKPGRVVLSLYDILGRKIRDISDIYHEKAGDYSLSLTPTDASGKILPTGLYFISLHYDDKSVHICRTKKVIFTR